ncbi:hypothetical protein THAOC_21153 [Thalassiosira oceanica]|uniref:RING-type domain-containing protein n=1 Tax=Thalassiosira oceanica TaxID=159749 RepID=K0S0A5_THAOC|nr:hypothetical protein THAOC_21153 [Thalassiosira oceanica]|eukprot:EJK58700.1 hypothetical protein THAOC_21153 [Thalassiosira oceanica]
MVALKHDGNARAGDTVDSVGESTLSVGSSVKIHGLQSQRGKSFNGKSGTITTELDGETGRHSVRLKGGRVLAVKPANLTLTAAQPAADVKIHCGACERALPTDSYSREQGRLRQSMRRCKDCVASGNQLVLMMKGRARSEEDECPICNLPLPMDENELSLKVCCMKRVCNGCILAARKRGMRDCPFCRTAVPDEASKALAMVQKRVDAGDPVAIYALGDACHWGVHGVARNVTRAVELYERAAELGFKRAHYSLGCLYEEGIDVQKDTVKAIRHFEAAAMCGHVSARFNLGCGERNAKNLSAALQHWIIAAKLGDQHSLSEVKEMFKYGLATKGDYAESLCGYRSAIEEMSSPDRDEANALGHEAIREM